MPYARDFTLRLEDVDANYEITNKAILALMENTSDENSALVGDDIMSLNRQGQSWVIVEWNLEVYARPKYREQVTVHTWPREVNSRFVLREFEIFQGDQKIAAASSKWMLINLRAKSIIRFDGSRIAKYTIEDRFAVPEPTTKRLQLCEQYDQTYAAIIRRSDMDLNDHLHNLAYLDIIQEAFAKEPDQIRIIFHREIKLGDQVFVKVKNSDSKTQIAIVNEANGIFSLIESNQR